MGAPKTKIRIFKLAIYMCGFLFLLFLVTMGNVSFCEEQATNVPAQEVEEGDNITLDFKDVDIQSVLRILSDKGNVNIVAGKDVVGTVTIRLVDVSWRRALDVILKTYGYGYEWISDKVIMVSTLEKIAQRRKSQEEAEAVEPIDTQIFVLNFSRAEDIKKAIENLVSQKGKINLENRTNSIIISDTKSNLKKIEEVIKGLDKVTPQVMIEAKIIEATLGTADKLGIDWTMKITAGGAKRPTTLPFSRWSTDHEFLGKNMYPIPKHETKSEYVEDMTQWIANPNATGPEDAYVHPYIKKITVTSDFPFTGGETYSPNSPIKFSSFPGATADQFTFGTLDFSQFQAVLEVLKSRADTKIVSNPRITTLNNQEANIIVGTVVPIPTYSYSTESGTRVISGYQDQRIGVKLTVTPNINEQSYITLNIKPNVEEIAGWTGPGNERPIISTRGAEAKVMIKDGQTLVMGGLISEKKIKSDKKVPFLGDLPIIGTLLFTKKSETVDKTDLLIFITPRIVKEG
ncbi:MAG: hypothetical protein NC828_03795 [Candidatus Omnitrophica bacterium]|nr:hypothetical protein [Candidatus Omnitrophota bacterium]